MGVNMDTKIQTTWREVTLDDVQIAEWHRGSGDEGLINIHYGFKDKGLESLTLREAEMFAQAILSLCKDARERGLIDEDSEPATTEVS